MDRSGNDLSAPQVEGLLDRRGKRPPVMDFVVSELERLGYSWSYRIIETAGADYSAQEKAVGVVTCVLGRCFCQ